MTEHIKKLLKNINDQKRIKIRTRQLKNEKLAIFFDYYFKGNRKRKFTKIHLTGDKKSDKQKVVYARSLRDKLEIELMQKQNNFMLYDDRADIIISDYFEDKQKDRIKKWKYALQYWKDFTKKNHKDLTFSELNPDICQDYAEFLKRKLSNTTARGHFTRLKSILNLAQQEGIIKANPAKDIRIKAKARKKPFLTSSEIEKLKETECPGDNVKAAFLFGCYTGLRVSDLSKLKFSDIYEDRVIINQQKIKDDTSMVSIPLHDYAKQTIEDQRDKYPNGEIVFPGISSSWTNQCVKVWSLRAGINKNVTMHVARHTFITQLLSKGVDIYTVSKLAGHSSIETTLVYANLVDPKRVDAINKLS